MRIRTSDKSTKNKDGFLLSRTKQSPPLSRSNFSKLMVQPTDSAIIDVLFADSEHLLSNISLLIDEIQNLGQELVENPIPANFLRYKKHITVLLKIIGKNTEMLETTARVGFTRTKLFRTAHTIDDTLATLAIKILEQEKNRIEILNLTKDLQGLILDIIA